MNKLIILLICTLIGSVRLQAASSQGSSSKVSYQNPCISKTTCRECIQTQNCAWCLQPNFGDAPRCFQPDLKSMSNVCEEEFTWYPDNEQVLVTNRELTRKRSKSGGMLSIEESASGSASGSYHESGMSSSSGSASGSASSSIVQISPQRVGLKLRTNEKHVMTVRYSQAEDYPVDLYYLMDLSKSMEDDKDKLSKLGDLLSATMKNITSNFRLGFGSFVDKVLMPYVSTVPRKLQSPCDGCEAPYGYKNHMPLNMDTKKFADEVRNAAVSGNLDAPEGGFDAIMQAIVCRDQIRWREQARHLLVFSTDAGFHYAGDGKLGGVITPNDGECHLDDFGMYTHSKVQDYPSISQINLKVKKNSINIIFAVTKQQISVYNKLSNHIEGSYSAELSEDSSNVVEMVQEQYNKISSSVEMKDNATSDVKIKYFSTCLGNTRTETNKCDGLKVGDVVSFDMEIVVTSCPQDPNEWFQKFQIYPVGINESLIIDLEMLCSCPCEQPDHAAYEEHSQSCNLAGTLKCGICECDETHFGRNCECATNDILDNKNLYMGCRDNTSLIDCNGQGDCSCGQCQCYTRPKPEEVISGKYCECDNFSCDRHNGLLCSGPDHGTCVCKECVCQPGWTGSACECRESNDTCIAPNSSGDVLCSGHGDCECGACRCHITEEGRYSGHYCERCPTCAGRCQDLKECVQCQVYKNGPLKDELDCSTNCSHIHVIHVTTLEHDEKKDEHLCTFYDEDECRFQFVYTEDKDNKVIIRAQEDRECPPKVFMLGIVLGVIAAIVLIGMAMLLIWKAVTTISDRREFARFEKERMMAKWDTGENPIYKQATSTFKNPTYAGK